jgi:diaminohydroxyphosphoribosylaminopyrimidine deaminase/5-amino-6-(5-phosphoribosylamino)uracil reductase
MSTDTLHMARALALAERGRGRTSPNPMVGAVVVDDEGVVVGRGSHQAAGQPHAEILAFADAGPRTAGATLYCTLEPCSHVGRTGPCAPEVVHAGIRRAVIAVEDPNPLVSGRGLAYLRQHGVIVTVGVLREVAERLNAPFFTVMRYHRPFVTMKVALSRENCVAGAGGHRLALTGPSADRYIHRDRAELDAIGVGSGTLLVDDPLLTARGAFRARPLTRVIFDRRLRTPATARLMSTLADGPIIVMASEPRGEDERHRAERLRNAGARVELVEFDDPDRFLRESLARLARLGVSSLMLEGGPMLHHAAWTAGVIDRVQMFMTPTVAGTAGVPWLDSSRIEVDDLADVRTLRLGSDVMIEGYVHRPR